MFDFGTFDFATFDDASFLTQTVAINLSGDPWEKRLFPRKPELLSDFHTDPGPEAFAPFGNIQQRLKIEAADEEDIAILWQLM